MSSEANIHRALSASAVKKKVLPAMFPSPKAPSLLVNSLKNEGE